MRPCIFVCLLRTLADTMSHRPWDICAGAIIAQEAGGFVAGGHGAPLDNDVNEEILWGRKYIVVRAIGDSEASRPVHMRSRVMPY